MRKKTPETPDTPEFPLDLSPKTFPFTVGWSESENKGLTHRTEATEAHISFGAGWTISIDENEITIRSEPIYPSPDSVGFSYTYEPRYKTNLTISLKEC